MSAILYPQPRAITRPRADVPASGAEKSRFDRLALQLIGFISISILTYAGASLAGNILLESARNEAIQASARTRMARMEVASLRQRVDEMTSMRAVQDYASMRGFVAIDGSPNIPIPGMEGRRVAQRGNR
jgi:hypothetical protein